jgi:acyl transferase domain-containing protein
MRNFDNKIKSVNQEPIAIIGIGCRFPGGSNNPATFWELLKSGKDAIVEVPKERWSLDRFYDPNPEKPGKMYVRSGGFLQQRIDQFDALFFGISPREAIFLDPQQCVLLEVAWEALEDAGLVPSQLAGSETGVYIGGFMLDNMASQMSHFNLNQINIHSAVSFTMTMLSNRLSYVFDFRGPSITMDTACSSSLVTLHEACQALWQGECLLALAGGVNIMHRPETPIAMCKGQFLAPDGHSKSFDERADGYGRGEGAGIVVLKPLSAALQDGDDIYALVRGTGVNQDGRTSGITVPNPEAQKALIRQVCAQTKVMPHQIRYIEAHGTGTELGDPTEASALGEVLGKQRLPGKACLIGSVKANIGHLEAAAGIAGLIKAALCLKHQQIPPLANLETPNPQIPFEELGLRLPRSLEPMPEGEGPAYVAINAFGYGGTNAHAILQEASMKKEALTTLMPPKGVKKFLNALDDVMHKITPQEQNPKQALAVVEETFSRPYLLPLSARSKEALSAQAQSYLTFIEGGNAPALRDICYSASRHREHHNHRLALLADSQTGMIEQLQSFVKLGAESHLIMGQVIPGQAARPVFVFTGMGPQWWAMGHELLQHEPVFRQKAEECDAVFQRVAGWSILAEMKADENHSKITQTQIAQPANFVLQVALTALWHSWGIEPAAIVGHSVGEVTAAYVAGVLDLEEAISVSYHRSRVQKKVAGQGKMLAVKMTQEDVLAILSGHEDQVSIAAINSPTSVTLSGEAKRLEEIAAQLEAKGVFNRFLRVELAYHSPIMEPLKDDLLQSLSALCPKSPAIPLYSSVTGQMVKEASYDAEYWYQNIRQPVQFAKAIQNLNKDGHKLFIEVGPHPVLFTDIKQCLLQNNVRGGSVLTSLRRKQPEIATLLEAFGSFYTLGYPIDWQKFYANGGAYVKLPTYPWQRETYWHETEEALFDRLGDPNDHPLLGHRLTAPNPCWESTLNQNYLPYLNDHCIQETVVLPGAVYVEMGLAIHQAFYENKPCTLEKLTFHQTLLIHPSDEPRLRLNYDDARREYTVHSRSQDDNNWTLHATGTLSLVPLSDVAQINRKEICERCQKGVIDAKTFMAQLPRGLQYGPYFQGLQKIWLGSDEVLAQIEGYEKLATEHESYRIHPTLLDISFQSLIALLDDDDANVYVPVSILKFKFRASPTRQFWSYGCLTNRSAGFIDADIILCDDEGNVLVEVNGLRCQALTAAKVEELEYLKPWFYKVLWEPAQPVDMAKTEKPGNWLLFMDQGGIGEKLAEQLLAHDVGTVIQVRPGSQFQQQDKTHFLIRRDSKPDMAQLMETVAVGNCQRVVYLWGLDIVTCDDDPTGLAESVACLHFIQSLYQTDKSHPPRFFLVTRGAQPVLDSEPFALAQVPIVGIGRVAATEDPSYRCTLVDIDPDNSVDSIPLLARELLANSPEQELALRGNERYVYRLVRESVETLALEANQQTPLSVSTAHPFELEIGTPAILDELRFRETQRREPGPREVEIKIHASAINTQDVLKVNKRLPNKVLENSFYGDSLGMEATGRIVRVGDGVKDYRAGDAIVALFRGSLRTYVTLPIDALFSVPKWAHIRYEESAGLLWAFVTAYYGLHHVARLQPGEQVLIHAATASIDLAALQVAQWIGAEVFATVESQAKRDYLNSLGIKHLMDSHSLDFVDQIKALTNGKGVDVILNSLTGEFALKNFSILAPYGR